MRLHQQNHSISKVADKGLRYKSFKELSAEAQEQIDFLRDIYKVADSPVAIIAPHGGKIEYGTSELVRLIAKNTFSYGIFEGIRSSNNFALHIESDVFDEPKILKLVRTHSTALAIHGFASEDSAILIGGKNSKLKKALKTALIKNGYPVIESVRTDLLGKSPRNICNRGRMKQGVQLEISRDLRTEEQREDLARVIHLALRKFYGLHKKTVISPKAAKLQRPIVASLCKSTTR